MFLEIHELDPVKFISTPSLAWLSVELELDLIINIDMLSMIEKGITEGFCNAIHHYAKANYKYMRDCDKNKEPSYINYWDVNNLHGSAMPQKLPTFNFEWVENTSQFNEDFVKNYDEKNEVGYIFEVDVKYPKERHEPHNNLLFSRERKKLEKVEKLVTSLEDTSEYFVHIKILKQAFNHGLALKKVYRVISFKQGEWLKPYIQMNNKLSIEAQNDFEKDFFQNNV